MLRSALLVSAVMATLLAALAASATPPHWDVAGGGFHRVATLEEELDVADVAAAAAVASSTRRAAHEVRVAIAVTRDFYIDVNELPKRATLTLELTCGAAVAAPPASASFSFVGAAADAPIDIEGPSFRSKTVPAVTTVTLAFRRDVAAPKATTSDAHGDALAALFGIDDAVAKQCVSGMKSNRSAAAAAAAAATGGGAVRARLSLPMHARYATPVGAVAPLSASNTLLSQLATLASQLSFRSIGGGGGGGGGGAAAAKRTGENYRDLAFAPHTTFILDGAVVVPVASRAAAKAFVWTMPVADAQFAQLVYWATTGLVGAGAVLVMLTAVMP